MIVDEEELWGRSKMEGRAGQEKERERERVDG